MAPNKQAGITLRASAETRDATEDFNKFLNSTQTRAESAASGMTAAYKSSLESIRNYSALAFAGVTAASGFAIKSAQEAETSSNRARASVRLAGASWDVYKSQVLGAASSLQNLTSFSEEEFLDVFARTVNLTGDVSAALDTMSKSADLAAALQIDLGSAGDLYAKALTGNVEMLARFVPALRAKLALLGEGATAAQKTSAAMEELAKFTGASAEAADNSATKWGNLGDQLGEIQEAVGGALSAAFDGVIVKLTPIVASVAEWIARNPELAAGITTAAFAVTGLTAAVAALGLALPAVSAGLTAIGVSASLIPGFGWAIAGAAAIAGLTAATLASADAADRHTKSRAMEREELAKIKPKPIVITINETEAEKQLRELQEGMQRPGLMELENFRLASVPQAPSEFISPITAEQVFPQTEQDALLLDYEALNGAAGASFLKTITDRETAEQSARERRLAQWQEEEAVWQGHLGALGAAYDTFTNTLINTDMTGKQRAQAMLRAAGAAFIQDIGARLKHAIAAEALILKAKITANAAGAAADSAGTAVQVANSEIRAAAESKSLAAKVYAFYASLGPFAIPAAAATLGVMFAGITAFASKFAAGGSVPGGGFSDSVPAMLTPGEYVVNRASAQANLPLLQMINAGRGAQFSGGGGGPVFHIHTDKDAGLGNVLELRRLFETWLPGALENARERGVFTPGFQLSGSGY